MRRIDFDLKITENPAEMAEIGERLFKINSKVYTEKITDAIKRHVARMLGDSPDEEKTAAFYRSIYNYWVYGFSVQQEFMFNLAEKSHEEKLEYLTDRSRLLYYNHLNDKAAADDLFGNKYNCYKFFKDYFRRDVILLEGEDDYEKFSEFVKKHPDFAVKPINLSLGFGIHKESLKNYESPRALFEKLLDERKKLLREGERDHFTSMNHDINLVLEELIEQVPELAKIHPASLNTVRITTVRVNGEVHIFYPCLRMGAHGSFVDNAGFGGYFSGVDSETGVVVTKIYDKNAHGKDALEIHPDTGVKILGFEIPRWDEAISLVKNLIGKLEKINYVGWDLALTPKGWCVIEGNAFGDLGMPQIVYQRGLKKDLEKIMNWKPDKQFWWE